MIHTAEAAKIESIAIQLALTSTSGGFFERGQAARELDTCVRHTIGVSKARYVAQFVKILLQGGKPIFLLGGWHREVYDIWMEALAEYNPVMYAGSESEAQNHKSKSNKELLCC